MQSITRWLMRVVFARAGCAALSCGAFGLPGGASPLPAQERIELKGEAHWVATGEAVADTLDDAKDAAVAAARASLLAFRKTRVAREIEQQWREKIANGRGDYSEDTTSRVRETVQGELRGSIVRESKTVPMGKQWKATASVACPETTLLPHRRLTVLEGRKDATCDDYLTLARDYAADEAVLEEQTLRKAWQRFATAQAALALARWAAHARQDGEAMTFADLAAGKATDDPALRAAIEDLRQEVRARVPTVEDLARELIELARTRSRTGTSHPTQSRDAHGKLHVSWPTELRPGERILKTWIDHEVTLHWKLRYADGSSDDGSARTVSFTWPPSTAGSHDAVLVLWKLEPESPLWLKVEPVADRAWARVGEVSEGDRLALRDLLQALRSVASEVAVVDLPRR